MTTARIVPTVGISSKKLVTIPNMFVWIGVTLTPLSANTLSPKIIDTTNSKTANSIATNIMLVITFEALSTSKDDFLFKSKLLSKLFIIFFDIPPFSRFVHQYIMSQMFINIIIRIIRKSGII